MIVSLKIWDDEDGQGGRYEIYNRKSFTCRNLVGVLTFKNKVEKDTLYEMLVKYHAEVEIIPNDTVCGNFADNFFKL
ncbi:MAG: hypothetical protein A4E32_01376 [Methanomassiliicoccales archaeon PtaU1.Bin124]|nr:MAG: hypothetical protein A4E32_01376 [Methanomassiliicoccales archaeon PtaU1.Bin124]